MKTKKEFKEELNASGYGVFSMIGDNRKDEYCLYGSADGKYVATIGIRDGKMIFDGKDYTDVNALLDSVAKYNSGLYFEADTYCPNYDPAIVREMRLGSVLKKCGFVNDKLDGYPSSDDFVSEGALGARFGKVLGRDTLSVGGLSYVSLCDDDMDDKTASEYMKGIIGALYAANIAKLVGNLNDMGMLGTIGDIEVKTIDPDTFQITTANGKEGIIRLLEDTLDKLKADACAKPNEVENNLNK